MNNIAVLRILLDRERFGDIKLHEQPSGEISIGILFALSYLKNGESSIIEISLRAVEAFLRPSKICYLQLLLKLIVTIARGIGGARRGV
jgi:hypothetical protein